MRRTQTDDVFLEAYDCRVKILNSFSAKISADPVSVLDAVRENVIKIQEVIGENRIRKHYQFFGSLVEAYRNLVLWGRAVRNAEQNSSRYQNAFEMHVKDAGKVIKEFDPNGYFQGIIDKFLGISSADKDQEAFELLKCISLPLPVYWEEDRSMRVRRAREAEENQKGNKPSTVYMSFQIDNTPVKDPHVVKPNRMMDLDIDVRVGEIPTDVKELVIRPVAEILQENFEMPEFRFHLEKGKSQFTAKRKMKIKCE